MRRRDLQTLLTDCSSDVVQQPGTVPAVHLKDGASGAITIYQLVMPEDADVELGLISTASPIGRAMLNKEEGDAVTVTTPAGSRHFELVKLSTIHDEG